MEEACVGRVRGVVGIQSKGRNSDIKISLESLNIRTVSSLENFSQMHNFFGFLLFSLFEVFNTSYISHTVLG